MNASPPSKPEESKHVDNAPTTVRRKWSPRRIRVTVLYLAVGLMLGVLMPPIAFIVDILVVRLVLVGVGAYPLGVSGLFGVLLLFLLVQGATRGTCKKTPIAPLAVMLGLVLGGLVWLGIAIGVSIGRGTGGLWYVLVALLGIVAMGTGALRGGKKGLRENLGTPQQGVGVLCARCGYDLHATAEHQRCPECGGLMRYPRAAPPEL